MFLLSKTQILYVVLACVACIAILCFAFYPLFRKLTYRKAFNKKYYKVINKLVIDEDYLLINNFVIKNLKLKIDHIVFANKYIYLIKDAYFEGALEGKIKDNKLIYYPYRNREVLTTVNPYVQLKEDYDNIVRLAGIDAHFFQLITLINDDVLINLEKIDVSNYHVVSRSNLISTIKNIENTAKVKDFNQDALIKAARDISRINERKRK